MGPFGTGVIAAVRTEEDFAAALVSQVSCIFLLNANILTLVPQLERAHKAGKQVFVHMDMAEGVGRDAAGVSFLHALGVDGVISTRASVLRAARDHGLPSVQRVFAIDSQATHTSAGALEAHRPTYLEIMPGVIPKVIQRFAAKTHLPIIAGGLVETQAEIAAAKKSGAVAVSTAARDLWG